MFPQQAAALSFRGASPGEPQDGEASGNGRLPAHAAGMRVGLFGGTFDPPHAAHRLASLMALRRLHLDRVWWLVTPGNPLKSGQAPFAERLKEARAFARHPRIDVSGIEAAIGTRYSYDTLRYLVARCPSLHFVWIMGADNLENFHRWEKWREIADMVPIAVIDRLGPSLKAGAGTAGGALARYRLTDEKAPTLPYRRPPAWVYLHGLKSPLSSTALRATRGGATGGAAARGAAARGSGGGADGHK